MDPLNVSGEHSLRSENLAFDIDVWYPLLSKHTFPTVFLPLRRSEAAAIVGFHDMSWRSVRSALTRAEVSVLDALECRLDAALAKSHNFKTHGAFLRLCGRSPKDGEPTDPTVRQRIWASYQQALERLVEEKRTTGGKGEEVLVDGNTRLAAVAETESWLRVCSGADAMSLLLTSERVFSDMRDWLHHGEPEQLVLREWSDAFTMATEFRCFVERGVLLGVSQYDTYVKYPVLQSHEVRKLVVQAIVKEWRKTRHCIDTADGSYAVDFGVNLSTGTAVLIELSPFRTCTGTALFKWDASSPGPPRLVHTAGRDIDGNLATADEPILRHVSHDNNVSETTAVQSHDISVGAVLRVRTEVVPQIGDLVDCNWDYRWSETRHDTPPPYRDYYTAATPCKQDSRHESWKAGIALVVVLLSATVVNRAAGGARGAYTTQLGHFLSSVLSHEEYVGVLVSVGVVVVSVCITCHLLAFIQSAISDHKQALRTKASHYLFVYGTLKRNCHWHEKHLSRAKFVMNAETVEPHALVIGDCGVPYMLSKFLLSNQEADLSAGKKNASPETPTVRGELFLIDEEMMDGMDDYEGISKGHYAREMISVKKQCAAPGEDTVISAWCYIYAHMQGGSASDRRLLNAPRISEYTAEEQKNQYKPIHHIQVKQLAYLRETVELT